MLKNQIMNKQNFTVGGTSILKDAFIRQLESEGYKNFKNSEK